MLCWAARLPSGSRLSCLAAGLFASLFTTFGFAQADGSAEPGFDAHGGPVKGLAISADGGRALTASFDYSVILWNLADQTVLSELHGHDAAVNAVAFYADDKRAVSASDDGAVGIWDLAGGELIARLEGHEGKVVAIAVSPDGRQAASAGWDRSVRLWDLENLETIRIMRSDANLNSVAFSVDGEAIWAGASDGRLHVWRAADGVQVMARQAHDFAVTGLANSPDGKVLATASVDETVQLWDMASGDPLITLYGHEGPVLATALSDDGRLVASGGIDGTVRVWTQGDGDRLKVYARHRGAVWAVAFAPGGSTLLSGGADGLVLTYDLDRDDAEPETEPPIAVLAQPPAAADRGDGRGAKLFRTCAACHTIEPDDGHKAGPTLHKIFGRKAGSHPGYRYSRALEDSELIWTEETVDRLFDIGPDHLLPGTKMPLQRMPSARDRADLIAFLKKATTP